ncbi:MAG: site-specific integrase [Planctomycetes bacterium]|nr:site-specific integrase [Planctomycetota bacterium]
MPRPKNAVPQPRQHKGRAVLDVYENGTRRTRTLGAWGSSEADAEYKRFLAEYATGATDRPDGPDATVNEVLVAFLKHADQHYRHTDSTPTSEVGNYKMAIRPLRELYGHTPAREFGPKSLKTLRDHMIGLKWCRGQVNAAVGRVKRAFKWAASEEMIPASVFHALQTVTGLRAGRSAAKERDPVLPVEDTVVDATLPFLNRHVRGLVEFQRLTGCRPGEACILRRCDIDTSGPVWVFRPRHHKNAHRGKARVIAIGPKAQELLAQFFTGEPADYLFSPRRVMEGLLAERSAARATPRYPSHMERNAAKRVDQPKRAPDGRYTTASYGRCIARACERLFPPPEPLTQRDAESVAEWQKRLTAAQRSELLAWHSAHRWTPNQLRHTFATRVRKTHGLEAAQVTLGHSKADTTQIYAERNEALAAGVAAKIG